MLQRPLLTMPQTAQTVAIALFAVLAAVVVWCVLRIAKRENASYPIWMVIGTVLASPYETNCALLGHFLYPQRGQISAYSLHDIPLPWYLILIYIVYVVPFMLFIFNRMERRTMSPRLWWQMFGVTALAAFLFEPYAIHVGLWTYWGENQPLKVFGLPLWWAFVNPAALMCMSLTIYLIWRNVLGRTRSYVFVILIPMGLFAFLGSMSAPSFLALGSFATQAATIMWSLLSIALAFFGVWIGQRTLEEEVI